ncbi:MAG: hypothetical protein K2M97_08100 [Muribaculaceae bacterium]|nr:hypothetical protein [Muribaculaceae bacterium]
MNHNEDTLDELNALIAANPNDADALYRRGRLHWNLGHRGAAISDFNASAELNPTGPGTTAAEHAMAIMDFFNPDLLNP